MNRMKSGAHVHDCTTPEARCLCGYQFRVPDISFSLTISDKGKTVVDVGFSTDGMSTVIDRLRYAISTLEQLERQP